MALDRDLERVAGLREIRKADARTQIAVGTLACPDCDAPVFLGAGPRSPADPLSCGFCDHEGRVRDFLTLGEPTRPTRVVVSVSGLARRGGLGALPGQMARKNAPPGRTPAGG